MARVPKPNIIWKGAASSNYTKGRPNGGRDGRNTFHHVVGSAESAVLVFQNPSRGGSAHLVISASADFAAYQMVSFDDTAYTDGNWQSNLKSITMEHHGDWRFGYNNAQVLENSAQVVAWLRDQGLVSRPIRHRDVSLTGTVCPADLPVEAIWNRATEIIEYYKNKDAQPAWLKARTTANIPVKVYAQKDGLFLRNLDDPSKAFDSRRWGINQDFMIGSKTVIGGKTYFITTSSTNTNAAAGLLEGEVASTVWTPAIQWIPMDVPRMMKAKQDLNVIDLDTMKTVGSVISKGVDIDFRTKTKISGVDYLRSKSSTDAKRNWGIRFDQLDEIAEAPPIVTIPQPESPEWIDSIIDEPNRPMYVIRSTPLIDLEDGKPFKNADGKDVWFEAGDIINDISAHVIIEGTTYRLTEYSYSETLEGNWKKAANGIDSNDLSVDPASTPEGTPANPDPEDTTTTPPSSGADYMEDLLKENNSILKKILEFIQAIFDKIIGK